MTSLLSYQSRDDVDDEMMAIGDDIHVTASTLEVDYDKNLTELYQAITDQNWSLAASICEKDPIQAAIWVVRHYNEENNENNSSSVTSPGMEPEIMWRFLPLHSACARQPPHETLLALINAYSDAAKCVDDQGMYALHYACGNQADESVIRLLLNVFSKAASIPDPRGMLPLHYTACWGPSSTALAQGVLDQLIQAYPPALMMRDHDGNTPLDLALDGDYPEKIAVADTLRQWAKKKSLISSNGSTTSSTTSSNKKRSNLLTIRQSGSHGSDYYDAIFVETTKDKTPLEPPETKTESKNVTKEATENIVQSSEAPEIVSLSMAPTPRQVNIHSESRTSPPLIPIRSFTKSPSPVQNVTHRELNLVQVEKPVVETVTSASSMDITNRDVAFNGDGEKESLQLQLNAMVSKYNDVQNELTKKINQVYALEQELDSTKILLEENKLECSDLKKTLGDLMEQHEIVKRKSANTHDRLSTLSISLDSMKEQQSILSKIVTERNGNYQSIAIKRKELFEQLLKMDLEVADAESNIDASLKKQTREMEAISAVINAALD